MLYDGHFNTIRSVLEDPNLPEIPRKRDLSSGTKFVRPVPKCAFEHDRAFKPGGTKMNKTATL